MSSSTGHSDEKSSKRLSKSSLSLTSSLDSSGEHGGETASSSSSPAVSPSPDKKKKKEASVGSPLVPAEAKKEKKEKKEKPPKEPKPEKVESKKEDKKEKPPKPPKKEKPPKEKKTTPEKVKKEKEKEPKSKKKLASRGNSSLNLMEDEEPKKKDKALEIAPEILQRQRELEQFLLNLPPKKLRGTTWQYFDIAPESYEDVMVVIHGGGVRPEAMFELMISLTKDFRVIVPSLPEQFNEIEDYATGLTLILRHEQVKKVHIMGMGFGSVVAHHFLYCYPNRVRSCILIHPVSPDEKKAEKCEKALRKGDFSKPHLLRMLTGHLAKVKDIQEQIIDINLSEAMGWVSVLKKFAASKHALQARVETLIDLHSNYFYEPSDFSSWKGRVLLVFESEDDPLFDREDFNSLQQLHPQAFIHYFYGSGYLLPLIRPNLIIEQVKKFLSKKDLDQGADGAENRTDSGSPSGLGRNDLTEEDSKAETFESDEELSADITTPADKDDKRT